MKRRLLLVAPLLFASCRTASDRQTLAGLRAVEPDLAEVRVSDGLDQAMDGYRQFLDKAPIGALTPEAMRRLADLKLEKEYGLVGDAKSRSPGSKPGLQPSDPRPLDAPAPALTLLPRASGSPDPASPLSESAEAFEARATAPTAFGSAGPAALPPLPGSEAATPSGPLEALALYDQILKTYPDYPHNDQVLYQKARALDELGRVDEAIEVAARLVAQYPGSRHLDEVQFRRAEYFFTRKKFLDAERAYAAIVEIGPRSEYFELALYKLGWTYYKQTMLPEALGAYVKLLDRKVETGYDFDQTADEADAQRIADSYRVMSLCFSDLGGASSVASFFGENGARPYENRIYRNLAEFYFEKLRYQDAADTYEAFVALFPNHASSPHFSMRVVEIYQAGDFPKLVLEAKKSFASRYALDAEFWRHADPATAPDVIAYLKRNLEDLANHYHALYQGAETDDDRRLAFDESASWYRRFLGSFPDAPETPAIHYRLADLLLENQAFAEAADAYEHIAYAYPAHDRSAAAGYAAIFARRKSLERASESAREPIRREAVASTVRFVDHFPDHEQAATVLGLAVDDLYDMKDFAPAVELGRRLTSSYRDAPTAIRRSAWLVIGHASFELADFAPAEEAYGQVLALMGDDDPLRSETLNNLAASIYEQGERAKQAGDLRGAADQFLRIAAVAPHSDVQPIAEYDAGVALLGLEDWSKALSVLESFRTSFPDHALHQEATRQVALVYRKTGNDARAAEEYERVAKEADKPELRAESLLLAGELYVSTHRAEQALGVYGRYVSEFTRPIETAVVTRFKMAELYQETGDTANRLAALRQIVTIDREAGAERTDGVRGVAARAALLLAEDRFEDFDAVRLRQPFERSLQDKQHRMDETLAALGALVDYRVGEVTAAATFYMAETYAQFSRALMDSERPADLSADERAEYDAGLEDEALPFEEKAIAVHEKNLELMTRAKVHNAWTEKSLARLAELVPARYARSEESTGPVASLETWSYRLPEVPTTTAPTADATSGAASVVETAASAEAAPAAAPEAAAAAVVSTSDAPATPLESQPPAAAEGGDDAGQ